MWSRGSTLAQHQINCLPISGGTSEVPVFGHHLEAAPLGMPPLDMPVVRWEQTREMQWSF